MTDENKKQEKEKQNLKQEQNQAAGEQQVPRIEASDTLHRRFGFGYETVTGIGEVTYKYDDRAAGFWILSSAFWFVVVTTFGFIISIELFEPEAFAGIPYLVFSRVRPAHVEGVIFAWLTMMYFGGFFHFLPRLLGTKSLWNERLAIWTGWVYNFTLAIGFITLLLGLSQGREYAEFIWPVDILVLAVFISNIVNTLGTVAIRKVRPLYVSVWWAMAAPAWVAISIAIENAIWFPGNILNNPSGALPVAVHDVLVNWWGNHNLFGLWLTPALIAITYYVIPRLTNTPLYSHTLSLISFWGLVFVYAGVGDHHLLQTPTPGWLKTIASVNSVGILIPVFAFFTNVFLTMRGNWDRFFTSLPVRYVMTGFIFYILVNLQGAVQAIQPFNVYVHFTNFTIGHAHLALLGGFTILGMGVVYYIVPQILSKPPYSRALAEWQFWLVTFGFLLFFTSLTIAAFVQGQNWMNGIPEVNVLPMLKIWNALRSVAGGMIYASGLIQLYNLIQTYRVDTGAVIAKQAARDAHSGVGVGAIQP